MKWQKQSANLSLWSKDLTKVWCNQRGHSGQSQKRNEIEGGWPDPMADHSKAKLVIVREGNQQEVWGTVPGKIDIPLNGTNVLNGDAINAGGEEKS